MKNVFQRNETKYLITEKQCTALLEDLKEHIRPDEFGDYLVQNLYYDTKNWDIIRKSIEKPLYKEKMRLRCYGTLTEQRKLFLELKKKYKGVVYKRRVAFPAIKKMNAEIRDLIEEEATQISRELAFHLFKNPVDEKMYLSHKRRAFAGVEDKELRITFDKDIRYRIRDLDFKMPDVGTSILSADMVILEIKVGGGMPLWLTQALSKHKIFPRSFSKYGTCYADHLQRQRKAGVA